MKTIIFTIFYVLTLSLFSQNLMRRNFGANNPIIRINIGRYTGVTNPESGMLRGIKMSVEAMTMYNNNHNINPDEMERPRFVHLKAFYDDFKRNSMFSLSYGQSTTCGFIMKGFWTIGISSNNENLESKKNNIGARASFNGYTKNTGFQSEIYVFNKKILLNINIFKRVKNNFLLLGGIENNLPKIGMGAMWNKLRITIFSQVFLEKIQIGGNLTINL